MIGNLMKSWPTSISIRLYVHCRNRITMGKSQTNAVSYMKNPNQGITKIRIVPPFWYPTSTHIRTPVLRVQPQQQFLTVGIFILLQKVADLKKLKQRRMLEKIFKFLLQDTSYHIFCISQSYIQETGQDTLDWWRGRSSSTEGGDAYKQCQLHI